jgi:hypothetical protein
MKKELRGVKALLRDAVHHGSVAVERIQIETARRPFAILEAIPGVKIPAAIVHVIHDASVSGTHAVIRAVNGAVHGLADQALVEVETVVPASPPPDETPRGGDPPA